MNIDIEKILWYSKSTYRFVTKVNSDKVTCLWKSMDRFFCVLRCF